MSIVRTNPLEPVYTGHHFHPMLDTMEQPKYEEPPPQTEATQPADGEPAPKKSGSKAQGRKRTKTGCLTCRRRRIKCGEERPTCQNCTKSKRQCEGYNQRVVFKDPQTSSLRLNQMNTSSQMFFPEGITDPRAIDAAAAAAAASLSASPEVESQGEIQVVFDTVDHTRLPEPKYEQGITNQEHHEFGAAAATKDVAGGYHTEWVESNGNLSRINPEACYNGTDKYLINTPFDRQPTENWEWSTQPNAIHPPMLPPYNMPHGLPTPDSAQTQFSVPQTRVPDDDEEMVEDVDDIDDMEMDDLTVPGLTQRDASEDSHLQANNLGVIVALQARQERKDFDPRTFTSLLDRPNMLAAYVPSPRLSPLNDSMTARIFCHFINVTAPAISMFERHPINPSYFFQGRPVARSQQHIWAYTLPTLAFRNKALLHAILAMSSLHIAKLQNGPVTASLNHYAFSLRRIAKSVSQPQRRGEPALLAAVLLLSFYECFVADHQKWSSHVFGAQPLLLEIGLDSMTKAIKARKTKRRQEQRWDSQPQQSPDYLFYEEHPAGDEVDENLVSIFLGRRPHYDQSGQVIDEDATDDAAADSYTDRDLEIYETQRDLFWWYCKQDMFQSVLGGGRLALPFKMWDLCPPRAPLGRLNATYGTYDHVIILLGRVSDFAARDLRRKRLAVEANGGFWRPSNEMSGPSGSAPAPISVPVGGPTGMLPTGFDNPPETIPSPPAHDEHDAEVRLQEAKKEWQEIRNAFTILEDHFGPDFAPLGPAYSTPIQSPFGTALQYRTYGIAGIWLNLYMGLILCYRAHPSMPPAAMMATRLATRETAAYATAIGRIMAGIAPDCSSVAQVNPAVGGALIEASLPLFVAGVQFTAAPQRAFTIARLRDMSRLSGWESGAAASAGCETFWVRMGESGKGPAYVRTGEERKSAATDRQATSSGRRVDALLAKWAAHGPSLTAAGRPGGAKTEDGKIVVERTERVHYALGLMGMQVDFEALALDNDEDEKKDRNRKKTGGNW